MELVRAKDYTDMSRKAANIISVISDEGIVLKTWFTDDFTERKLSNTVKKISKELNGDAQFIKTF